MTTLPVLVTLAFLSTAEPAEAEWLPAIPVAHLLQEYEVAGLALAGTTDVPTDEPISRVRASVSSPELIRFIAARREMLRRGTAIVPQLMEFAEAEAVRQRKGQVSFTTDILGLLADLGDPRAVPTALRILELDETRTRRGARRKALDVLEQLTFCAFHRVVPHSLTDSLSIQHPNATQEDFYEDLGQAARLYRDWLDGEGNDPTKWLALARQRARRLLTTADPNAIYCAARFFQVDLARDDDPAATLVRLAAVMDEFQPTDDRYVYRYRGQNATTVGNWFAIVADYGPQARLQVQAVLRIARELGDHHDNIYGMLGRIGGSDVMAYYFEKLPIVRNRVILIESDPNLPKFFSSDDQRLAWLASLQEIRGGIDRNAGRVFATDDERKTWWTANRTRSAEQWVSDNLETLIGQAESEVPGALRIAYAIVPDLPKTPISSIHEPTERSRPMGLRRWLHENRSRLRYDSVQGVFRLPRHSGNP